MATQRSVSYDGSNVDFGNPLYASMNAEKLDTNPAYDESDRKYMPEVSEISGQNPYVKGSMNTLPSDE